MSDTSCRATSGWGGDARSHARIKVLLVNCVKMSRGGGWGVGGQKTKRFMIRASSIMLYVVLTTTDNSEVVLQGALYSARSVTLKSSQSPDVRTWANENKTRNYYNSNINNTNTHRQRLLDEK